MKTTTPYNLTDNLPDLDSIINDPDELLMKQISASDYAWFNAHLGNGWRVRSPFPGEIDCLDRILKGMRQPSASVRRRRSLEIPDAETLAAIDYVYGIFVYRSADAVEITIPVGVPRENATTEDVIEHPPNATLYYQGSVQPLDDVVTDVATHVRGKRATRAELMRPMEDALTKVKNAGLPETVKGIALYQPIFQELRSSSGMLVPFAEFETALTEMLRSVDDRHSNALTLALFSILVRFKEIVIRAGQDAGAPNTEEQNKSVREYLYHLYMGCCWAESGFPSFRTGHKLAAALMTTTLPPEVAAEIQPPHQAFLVPIPDGLVPFITFDGMPVFVTKVLVTVFLKPDEEKKHWSSVLFFSDGRDLFFGDLNREDEVPDGLEEEMVDRLTTAMRAIMMVRRLIYGICIALENTAKPTKPHKQAEKNRNRAPGELPKVCEYVVGADIIVQHDFREDVKEYLSGKSRKAMSVQSKVRGHYRNQVHGPRDEQGKWQSRRWQWIQPFWKGLDKAPILIRPHQLKEKTEHEQKQGVKEEEPVD